MAKLLQLLALFFNNFFSISISITSSICQLHNRACTVRLSMTCL